MRRTVLPTITILALTLAGCAAPEEPSSPPAPQEALSTSSATAAAPPEPPSTSEVTTAEPAAVTQEPEEEAVTATATPDQPPEIPHEAQEASEEGAAAFAQHYMDLVNWAGSNPTQGVLEPLATASCETCQNYANNVSALIESSTRNSGPGAKIQGSEAVEVAEGKYIVTMSLEQNQYDVLDEAGAVVDSYEHVPDVEFKFTLIADDPWLIDSIQVAARDS